MRILIVEDEVRLAEALGEIMKAQRYTTDIVYDGEAVAAGDDFTISIFEYPEETKGEDITANY